MGWLVLVEMVVSFFQFFDMFWSWYVICGDYQVVVVMVFVVVGLQFLVGEIEMVDLVELEYYFWLQQ